MKLILGDCLEKLKELPDNSVDSIVTDPPYGLSFMNKKWDYDVPSTDIWKECLRVLKPGGHLLAFSGSRTYHRMVVRIEDAGFEIRDQIMWVYGSGFPKSHNIGKAVDKLQGNEREVVEHRDGTQHLKTVNSNDGWKRPIDEERILNGYNITKGISEWEGWGTALKPAHEPIVMARKPLSEKTVAENVLRWGTGGINIDDSRIGERTENESGWSKTGSKASENRSMSGSNYNRVAKDEIGLGRWPANIIFDEEAGQVLDQQSGISESKRTEKRGLRHSGRHGGLGDNQSNLKEGTDIARGHNDKGGASRFFYCPKASKKDRDEGLDEFEKVFSPTMGNGIGMKEHNPETATKKSNSHPTVKPTALMEYLIKLVTPKGGTVLDCFLGSGSTGKAAVRNGFDFIGIEREEEYIKIAEARIKNELNG